MAKFDVLVVGGGVIGLSIARELRRNGVRKIAIVEKGRVGEESSWAAAGMLGPQAETDGVGPFFDLCSRSRDLFPNFASDLLSETGVDIELDRKGTFWLAFSEADSKELATRLAWQTAAGLVVERLSASEVRKAEPFVSPDVREGLFFANDWQVDNRKLLAALRRYCDLNAIEILENTKVDSIDVDHGRATEITTQNEVFSADQVVVATGAWTSLVKLGSREMPVKVIPVRGQIIAYRTAKRVFDHVICSGRGYLVPRADGRVLFGSTAEHVGFDRSTTQTAAEHLTDVAFEIAPSLAGQAPIDHWSGLRPFAADGLPVIGGVGGVTGLTIASAHYRNGILLAPLTGRLVAERIVNSTESAAFTTFGADRFSLAASGFGKL